MDVSGEVADLMVKEGIQITEATVKLLAEAGKNLTALLWALARDDKKLVGKTGMKRLLREGKELKVFRIRESDLADFRAFAKQNVLFSAIKDNRATDGMIDLVTNIDFVSQVNLFMERRGYALPSQEAITGTPKKAGPLAQPDSSSQQRGNGSTASRPRPRKTTTSEAKAAESEKPSVRAALDGFSEELKKQKSTGKPRTRPQKTKSR